MHEAEKFLESIERQASYRRRLRAADPDVASEAVALESFVKQRRIALAEKLRAPALPPRPRASGRRALAPAHGE